ncbi:MAG TPA: FN3 associated domain-containing protein, partial [Chitinophagaceae bacterium]|nr:FN3 associated domain-containing protein [Chitinophagaceae bacterium]
LLTTALTAALTAVMGFLLSKEEGYNPQALWWHKWGGVALSLFCFGWYAWRNNIHRKKYLPQLLAIGSFVLVIFTGHQGSNITHGENYLMAPVMPEKTKPSIDPARAIVFTDMVQPILEEKCMSCHSLKKAKGQLVMETQALLLKGGKHGSLWESGRPEASLLLQRVALPEAEKKHMPPAGKPQLDEDETAILFHWIKSGASFTQKLADLPARDTLRLLAQKMMSATPEEELYDFSAAADKDIEKLNNTNRLVHPLAMGSPALAANFYNRQNYSTASLKELEAVKEQLVSLDMAYMPLTAADVTAIAQFKQLRKLNLNFSTVPGSSLATLQQLPLLSHLSLSGTSVSKKDIEVLTKFPKLQAVYLWNTPVNQQAIASIPQPQKKIRFETGFMNDTLLLKLNPPVLETEERIINGAPIALKLKHYIKGVSIRYTTDGSNPDSIHSSLYKEGVLIDNSGVLKARAYKAGWIGSDSIVATFYKNTFRADSIRSLTPLDSVFKGVAGAKTLINGEKGESNYRNGKWLGFRRNKMEMLLHYPTPVTVSSVTLSSVIDIGGYIMPPALIEVWGGNNEKALKRLSRYIPEQPDSLRPTYMRGYDCNFSATTVNYLKIVAVPVAKLPAWHPGKGQKGWLFTDELFVN